MDMAKKTLTMEEITQLIKSTPNDSELGKKIRSMYYIHQQKVEEYTKSVEGKFIYESPDGGKTIYQRLIGSPLSERTLIRDTEKFINPYKVNEVIEDWYKRDGV